MVFSGGRAAALGATLCLIGAVAVHVQNDARPGEGQGTGGGGLYIRSGETLKRLALSYDAVLADLYWIRAVQYFGRTRLARTPGKSYDRLYPLLDITTTLDKKVDALRQHASQVAHSAMASVDLVRTQAGYRGFQARCGAAEGFEPLRLVLSV